jgi:hypothetical protein
MNTTIKNLEKLWVGFGLGNSRPLDNATYMGYLWSEIPPLQQEFNDSFNWLLDKTRKADPELVKQLDNLQQELKITFPKDFLNLVSVSKWDDLIEASPTGCYFPEKFAVKPFLSGHLVKVYLDQQDVVSWFLYFESDEKECFESIVLSSYYDMNTLLETSAGDLFSKLYISENSFESFIYRMHLEIRSDYSLSNMNNYWKRAITDYLNFYNDKDWKKEFETLSEKEIENTFDLFKPAAIIARYKKLSEGFLEKYADQLGWLYISQYQALQKEFKRAEEIRKQYLENNAKKK